MIIDYDPESDSLLMVLSSKPIIREESPTWEMNLSYAADGEVVQIHILDASKRHNWPLTVIDDQTGMTG